MLVSCRWLTELLPSLAASPAEVAERLSSAGLAVDAITAHGATLASCLVATVESIEPHPKLDKVRLVTVDTGKGSQTVVCGASNVPQPGGSVVFCPVGTSLPAAGFTIEPRKIGGVLSEGMLASERELGLSDVSEGILVLAGDIPAGTPLVEACPEVDDTIFELDVTPNRPDALGHVGVARDLAALFGLHFRMPEAGAPSATVDDELSALVSVENRDRERCPHYGAAAVLDVQLGPSPDSMRWRLHRLGVRPISNVVDVTNWLLLEYGQPLHAFDLDRVGGGKIVVRRATEGEKFRTLDGVERLLVADDLVIADASRATALAGVMGGADSEISVGTKRVLLECAYFEPRGVRRSAKRHGLHTESSHRFERGTDWGNVEHVLNVARVMLTKLASGKACRDVIHDKAERKPAEPIRLRSERLNQLLGVHVPFERALSLLSALGLASKRTEEQAGQFVAWIEPASHRPDVAIEADLIDEVARVHGMDKIPTVLPAIVRERLPSADLERNVASVAAQLGLMEALTYSFVSEEELASVHALPAVVRLEYPLSRERNVMRTSLLPGLLDAVRRARRHGESAVRLYTVGARFLAPPAANLPDERRSFAAVLSGPRHDYLTLKPAELDLFDAKGIAIELIERVTQRSATLEAEQTPSPHLHPRFSGELRVGDLNLGRLGQLHPDVLSAWDLDARVIVIELDLELIASLERPKTRFRPIAKLPAVTRDLSLLVDSTVPSRDIQRLIAETAGELCESVQLASEYLGGSVPDGQRSLTYHIVYRDPKAVSTPDAGRTLTDHEVDVLQKNVLKRVEGELGATLRG